MAENATVARPYARAAFRYARERNELGAWSQLLAAGGAVAANPGAGALFGSPRVSARQLVELIAGVASESGTTVDTAGRNFLMLLADNRRLGNLPEIARQFEALKAEAENTLDVEVTTALALTAEQRTRLSEALARRFRRQVRIAETVDPTLLGGAIVRAGDFVVDGSVQGRLARLEQQISQP
jgi:F-type H+-transporting ATPase subunit delta